MLNHGLRPQRTYGLAILGLRFFQSLLYLGNLSRNTLYSSREPDVQLSVVVIM
jgi:hypothetical protein